MVHLAEAVAMAVDAVADQEGDSHDVCCESERVFDPKGVALSAVETSMSAGSGGLKRQAWWIRQLTQLNAGCCQSRLSEFRDFRK